MNGQAITAVDEKTSWFRDKILMGKTVGEYVRSLVTPFNVIAAMILAVGLPVMAYRFWKGLGASTHLSDINPWGLWLGFDMFFGVAVATGGFVMVVGVYLFGRKDYKPMVRPAILTGFLGYFFAIMGLAIDLGRYWALPLPFYYFGTASVLFLVAEHLCLYLMIQFIEFLPAVVEWLNLKKIRAWLDKIHIGAVILGSVLVMGHQSALGAMFLLMPTRLHPLWYSTFIPYLFFVSCLYGGIAMLIIESMISHNVFGYQLKGQEHSEAHMNDLTIGLAKAAAFCLFAYFALMTLSLARGLAHGDFTMNTLMHTGYGWWKWFEIGFGVVLPMFLYAYAVRGNNAGLARAGSIVAVLGVMINRFNVVMVGLNWNAPVRYFPSWMEIMGSLTLATIGVCVFKWIVNRMPVLYRLPDFPDVDH